MNEHEHDQELLNKVRGRLDADLDNLAPSITGRLRESRRLAIDLADSKPLSLFNMPRLVPAGGFATLAVVAVVVSLWFSQQTKSFSSNAAEEIEVLIVQGNLEMYKDLEFFQWLAQTHETR
jgi:hypothetical protein